MAHGPNPFRYLKPVPPEEFLGRWRLVEEIARDLTYHSGDSYACIGGRRFGKSSLLLALHHSLRQAGPPDGGHIVLPLLIDFKHTFSSENAFWKYVLDQIRDRTDAQVRRRVSDPSPVKVPLDQVWLDSLADEDPSGLPFTQFEQGLDYILAQLDKVDGPTRLILLLDEVDDVLDEEWHRTLFKQLRSLLSIGGATDIVRLVLSGSRRFLDAVSDRGSPLWNILQLRYLHVFEELATCELMDRAPELPEVARQAVWQQSGGHPFLAQYLLHHLWKEGLEEASESSVSRVVSRFLHEEEHHLTGWANAVEETGIDVYRSFVSQSGWLSEDELLRRADAPADRVKRALVALCYHGLIEHDGSWNCYRRTGDLFSQWFLSTHPAQPAGRESEMIPSSTATDAVDVPDHAPQPIHADALLVTVTAVEAQAVLDVVKERYDTPCRSLHIDNNTYRDLGKIGGARTFMVRSGMGSGGTRGAILTVTEGISALKPSAVVMVGIAFGIDPNKQRIGDVLVSRQILAYELQRVSTGDREEMVIRPRGDRPSASARLLARFEDGELDWNEAEVRFGLVLSGDKLVDNVDFREQLRKLEPEAIGGEMEGAGLYAAAARHHVDWILVKAICDWADGKKYRNKRQRQAKAAENAARFAIYVIEQGGFDGDSPARSENARSVEPAKVIHEADDAYAAEYNIAAIRQLLTAAFGPEALRRFCQDRPLFRPIVAEFGLGHGLNDMVACVIDYCWTQRIFEELLTAVKMVNSRQYAHFAPYRQPEIGGLDGSEGHPVEPSRPSTDVRSGRPQIPEPKPFAVIRPFVDLEAPRGVVQLESRLYIERQGDTVLKREIVKPGSLTYIRAARQTGKSSLLVRGIHHARQQSMPVAFVDCQYVDGEHLVDLDSFLRCMAELIANVMGIDGIDEMWQSSLAATIKMSNFLESKLLRQAGPPVLLAIDEADRIFGTNFQNDFFGLVRAWYNRAQWDGNWKRLCIAMVISTDPHLLIDDPYQSPFNVGTKIELEDFDEQQVADLNRRHGEPLTPAQVPEIASLLGGHPYLTRKALFAIVMEGLSWNDVLHRAVDEGGPFGDHLRHYLQLLHDKLDLSRAMKRIISDGACPDEETFYRLQAAGLVRRIGSECVCRCPLYERFFEKCL